MDKKQLKALENMPDSEIDTSDIPEITNWDNAVVGKFYQKKIGTENLEWTDEIFNKAKPASEVMPKLIGRGKQKTPVKVSTTIRLSNDVISYFKSDGKGWQSRIDAVLKEYVDKAHG